MDLVQISSNFCKANFTSGTFYNSTLNSKLLMRPASEKLLNPVITLPNMSGTLI